MRIFVFLLLLIAVQLPAQKKDSCNCISITPMPGGVSPAYAFATYTALGKEAPLTGICHTYYMKVAYVQPDYNRTYQYGRFEKGELLYYIQYNEQGDTFLFFQRVKKDSVVAVERKFDYFTGKLQSQGIYYYSGQEKRLKVYAYSASGYVESESNYFFPRKGDSLSYYGNHFIRYKQEAVLSADGFYNTPVQEGRYMEYGGAKGKIVTVRGAYHHNYKTGKWTSRYASGGLKSEGNYVEYDWRDGLWKEWYENGQRQSEIRYCRSNLCSEYKEWYPNGMEKTTGAYTDYRRSGTFNEYWENGKLKKRDTYAGSVLILSESWYETGQQKNVLAYNASGQQQGTQREWYPTGVVQSEVVYENGMPRGPLKEYYESGVLKRETQYNNNHPRAVLLYYPDGKLKSNEAYSGSWRHGRSVYYFPSEKVHRQGNAKGTDTTRIEAEINYKGGKWNGVCRWYFPDGKIWREGTYENGMRNGVFKEYNAAGKLVYAQTYEKGYTLSTRRPPAQPPGAQRDSLRAAYALDASVITSGLINAQEGNPSALYPPAGMREKILSDLVGIAMFRPQEFDSITRIHYDSSWARTHVYLDYLPVSNRRNDTTLCPPHPAALNKFIADMDFVPIPGECYGDDRGGIRRGFTTYTCFNGSVLDSIMRAANPRFGCEYLGSLQSEYGRVGGWISVYATPSYSDYTFNCKDKAGYRQHTSYTFRVYSDGSIDFIGIDTDEAREYW